MPPVLHLNSQNAVMEAQGMDVNNLSVLYKYVVKILEREDGKFSEHNWMFCFGFLRPWNRGDQPGE